MASGNGVMASSFEDLIAEDLDSLIDSLPDDDGQVDRGGSGREIPDEVHSPVQVREEEPLPGEPTAAGQDWRAILDKVDPAELLTHPRAAGILGNMVQKKVQEEVTKSNAQLRAEFEAEVQRKADEDLLRTDPYGYRDAKEEARIRQEAESARKATENTIRTTVADEVRTGLDEKVLYRLFNEQPVEVQRELSGKDFPGDEHESRAAYLDAIVKARVRHELVTARRRWESDALPALQKQLAEEGHSPNQPAAARGKAPARTFDAKTVESMSLADFEANMDAIIDSLE